MPSSTDETAGVTVREIQPEDIARAVLLIELGALVEGKEDPGDAARYRSALEEIGRTPGNVVLVAERDGEVVGVCQLIEFRHLQEHGGRCAELESVHVHPDHRSQGIGGLLVETAVERARADGCYRVQLTSNAARTDARRFYERHGFTASHVGFKRSLR